MEWNNNGDGNGMNFKILTAGNDKEQVMNDIYTP